MLYNYIGYVLILYVKEDYMNEEKLIPQKYRIISGSTLKIIAVVTMLIDHSAAVLVGCLFTNVYDTDNKYVKLYNLMRGIGRLAFPIYCFLLTEGFVHTHDRKKYASNLLIFAVISEIPWNLEHTGKLTFNYQNVFFTLFLGVLGMTLYEKYKGNIRNQAISLIVIYCISILIKCDYGCSGFCFIMMLYILRNNELLRGVIGAGFLSSTWKAGIAFIPISLYNGERGFIKGKFMKYLFYAIYPVHMFILYIIKKNVFGY